MVLQLHPLLHLAAPADSIQTPRRVRLVRGVVSDRLGADPALRARDQGSDARGAGPGLLRLDPQARLVPAQERAVALPRLGLAPEARAVAALLQTLGEIDGVVMVAAVVLCGSVGEISDGMRLLLVGRKGGGGSSRVGMLPRNW